MLIFIGPEKIVNDIRKADPLYLSLAVAVHMLTLYLWMVRWRIAVVAAKIKTKNQPLFRILVLGLATNNITPAKSGGEALRAYLLSKYSKTPFESSFATVLIDKGLDTFPLILLSIISLFHMILVFRFSLWLVIGLLITLFAVVFSFFIILYVSVKPELGKKVKRGIMRIARIFYKHKSKKLSKLESRISDAIVKYQDAVRLMIKNKNVIYVALPLSFVIWFLEIIRIWAVFWAFGVYISPIIIAEVMIVATLVSMVPIFPGGLGAIEGLMILFYSMAGVPLPLSAAITIVERLISFWLTIFLGVATLPYFGSDMVGKVFK